MQEMPVKKTFSAASFFIMALMVAAGGWAGWMIAKETVGKKQLTTSAIEKKQQYKPEENLVEPFSSHPTASEPSNPLTAKNQKPSGKARPIVVSATEEQSTGEAAELEIYDPEPIEPAMEDEPGTNDVTREKKTSIREKILNWLDREAGKKDGNEPADDEKEFTDITADVEVRTVVDHDQWMMGVRGQKLRLMNKSDLKLETAVLAVDYFNDQDILLESKQVTIRNIAPGQSKTADVPDHKLADHVAIKIVDARGSTAKKSF